MEPVIFNPATKLALCPEFIPYIEGDTFLPVNIEVSPSGVCHAGCPTCFYRNAQTGKMMTDEVFSRIPRTRALTWTGGGEPTLNENLSRWIEIISMRGTQQGLFTNLSQIGRINTRLLGWIRVTVTDKNLTDTDAIAHARRATRAGFCVNYSGPADDDKIREALDVCVKYGFDYVQVRPALNGGGKRSTITLPEIEHPKLQYTSYKFLDQSADRGYSACEGFHFVPFIWEDGLVTACAYHRHAPYILGDLSIETWAQIEERINDLEGVPVSDDCQVCCKNHEINKTIAAARAIEDRYFI